jgi:uncharacterized radical SAM superfamily Fe-S cluster-containing enzyme
MKRLGEETYIKSTLAYCDRCNKTELARITARDTGVFMERMCPVYGVESVKIAKSPQWYMERTGRPRWVHAIKDRVPSRKGCPFDCGPCQWHTGGIHLPVFSITNDCNLNCPICFTYNRPDRKYYMSVDETKRIINHIVEKSGGVQLINLTGGEPTLHPDLFAILEACRSEGIGRITMNTNGIRIAQDKAFAERIKESGVQPVLSLDTLDPEKSRVIHGKDITGLKKACLENLETFEIVTTILAVCIKGLNESEVAQIVHTFLRKPFVGSITIQNMTFTGRNGSRFEPRVHIAMDEIEELLCAEAGLGAADFFPLGSYHPLCYSAAYYIVRDGRCISLTRVLDRERIAEMSDSGYILNPKTDLSAEFRDGIHRLWASGADDADIAILRAMLMALYPQDREVAQEERMRMLEDWMKMLLIHPHMDRDNFDIDRVSACGDLVPDEQGRMIPACSYNLLYRRKDPRFWTQET